MKSFPFATLAILALVHGSVTLRAEEVVTSPVAAAQPVFRIDAAPAPLFDDPVWHGAADPTVIWNTARQEWCVYYTQRRASLPDPDGVKWCHGSAIGLATSKDGRQWKYEGVCSGDQGLGTPIENNCSWWAPCVIFADSQFHLFVSRVDGIYNKWTGKRSILHFASADGRAWKYEMTLPLSSDNCIDPCVARIGDKWMIWYKDEGHNSRTYAAESPDLKQWKIVGPAVTDVGHEAPLVWPWKGSYRMIVDAWSNGLRIYQSTDGLSGWKHSSTILVDPGSRPKDGVQGGHPFVLPQGDRAFVFYHVHYAKGRETVLQVAELEMGPDGRITCDRNKYAAGEHGETGPTGDAATPWPAARAWEWYRNQPWIVGFNFVPSTACNTTEFWSAENFDEPTIDRELGWAAKLGFNSCRVFVQYLVWKLDPDGLKKRMDRFLSVANKHGLSTTIVLFDDCAFGAPPQTEPYLGKQRDPIAGMILPSWTPSPGLKEVTDKTTWPDLEKYVLDVVGAFAKDRRVLLWDLYNEPGNSGLGNQSLPLVEATFAWARRARPTQPLTMGAWGAPAEITRRQLELSDVASFHFYGDAAGLRTRIAELKRHDRPLINTEWMARPKGSKWETDLPVFKQEGVGCYNWGLVNGRTQCQFAWENKPGTPEPKVWFHDLFHKDGTPYDAAEHEVIRKVTADKQIHAPAPGSGSSEGAPHLSDSLLDLKPHVRVLFDEPIRDPSMCLGPDGTYYLTGTSEPFWGFNNQNGIRVWKSKDMVKWEPLGTVWRYGESPWHKPYLDAKKPLWAPEIHYKKGTFWLTYSMPGWQVGDHFENCGSGLLKSTTGKPEGPYVDVSPNERLGDEIDASLFEDTDGSLYFVWHRGMIRKLKPDASGPDEPMRKLTLSVPDPDPTHHSNLCAMVHGRGSFDHIGYEGAFLFKVGDTYVLSGSDHYEGKYTCWIATSKTIYGPYSARYPAIPFGGHNMFFQDKEGQWWSTIFNGPINERPGVLPLNVEPNGQVSLRAPKPGETPGDSGAPAPKP